MRTQLDAFVAAHRLSVGVWLLTKVFRPVDNGVQAPTADTAASPLLFTRRAIPLDGGAQDPLCVAMKGFLQLATVFLAKAGDSGTGVRVAAPTIVSLLPDIAALFGDKVGPTLRINWALPRELSVATRGDRTLSFRVYSCAAAGTADPDAEPVLTRWMTLPAGGVVHT